MARRTRTTAIGAEKAKKLSTHQFVEKFRDVATISPAYADNTAVAELKTGVYTYKGLFLYVKSNAEIAGETVEVQGKHYVKSEFLSKYLGKIKLEIDGTIERDLTAGMHLAFNQKDGHDTVDGMLYMPFGGPFMFDNKRAEDAYALGTSNVRSLRVNFDLTSEWIDGQLQLGVHSEYTPVRRNLEYIRTQKSYRYAISGSGEFTISDLPVHADIGAIYVLSDDIKTAKLVIDDQELFDADNYPLRALNELYGTNITALGEGVAFDFLRTKEVTKGVRGLETAAERKRNADIRLTLDMIAAGEVVVIIDQIGRYSTQ